MKQLDLFELESKNVLKVEKEAIVELAKKGYSMRSIAKKTQRDQRTIAKVLKNIETIEIQEKKINNQPLTFQERKLLQYYKDKPFSSRDISAFLDRGCNTAAREYRANGGRENYNAKIAHKRAVITKEKADGNRSITLKKNALNPFEALKKRIHNLEMQVEILLDVIKEFKEQNDKKNT